MKIYFSLLPLLFSSTLSQWHLYPRISQSSSGLLRCIKIHSLSSFIHSQPGWVCHRIFYSCFSVSFLSRKKLPAAFVALKQSLGILTLYCSHSFCLAFRRTLSLSLQFKSRANNDLGGETQVLVILQEPCVPGPQRMLLILSYLEMYFSAISQ